MALAAEYESYERVDFRGYGWQVVCCFLSFACQAVGFAVPVSDDACPAASFHGGYGLGNNEWHYMVSTDLSEWEDATENVFDYQIYSVTSSKNHFSYISTCLSGNLDDGSTFLNKYGVPGTGTYGPNPGGSEIIGMPYAWTHGASLSTNGFSFPDTGAYVYIGFDWGSAALDQYIFGNAKYHTFVYHFFDGLLNLHLTVNQALDYAAHTAYPPLWFAGTPLYQGTFEARWPDKPPNPDITGPGRMVVYGNGDIYMYTGGPDYVTLPSLSGLPNPGYINTPYQFTASATDPYGYQLSYTINWGDGSPPTTTGLYPSGSPVQFSHTWTSANAYTIMVTAQSQNGVSSSPSHYTVTINNPQPVYHDLTVSAFDVMIGSPYYLYTDVQVDGEPVGITPLTIPVEEGWHEIEVGYGAYNPWLGWSEHCIGIWYDDGYITYGGSYGTTVYIPIYHDMFVAGSYAP